MTSSNALRPGLAAGVAAFSIWGFLPVYFKAVAHVAPDVTLAHRVAWSLPTGIVFVALASQWPAVRRIVADPKLMRALFASAALMAVNWLIYIWAVAADRVMEGSLGYYINPLVSFAIGAVLFSERFSKWQLFAILLASIGVLNQTLVVGAFPWVALSLCLTFAAYGAIRKATPVESRAGFLVEVVMMAPFAFAYLVWLSATGADVTGGEPWDWAVLALAGPITAAPLILFAIAARNLRLSTVAILQFIGPTLQFACALYYGEPFTAGHAVTFAFIWAGVAVFSYDAWASDRLARAKVAAVG